MLRSMVRVKVASTWGRTQSFPSEHCPKHHTAPAGLPSSGKCCKQTRPSKWRPGHLLPLLQFWCSHVHCWCFQQWTGSAWAPWLVCSYAALYSMTLCAFWHLSTRTRIKFLAIWATATRLLHWTTWASLCMILSLGHRHSLFGPVLVDTDHCRP